MKWEVLLANRGVSPNTNGLDIGHERLDADRDAEEGVLLEDFAWAETRVLSLIGMLSISIWSEQYPKTQNTWLIWMKQLFEKLNFLILLYILIIWSSFKTVDLSGGNLLRKRTFTALDFQNKWRYPRLFDLETKLVDLGEICSTDRVSAELDTGPTFRKRARHSCGNVLGPSCGNIFLRLIGSEAVSFRKESPRSLLRQRPRGCPLAATS